MPPVAASGLSRAPAPSGIRSAARERVGAVRKPGGDVATEWRSPRRAGRFPSRARNGAETGGLRTTLYGQRVVVGCGIYCEE